MYRDVHEFEPPLHPGEILREHLLPAYGLSQRALARHLRMSRWLVGEVVRERRAMTPELAAALGQAFGQGPHYWLSLQFQHDLWNARIVVKARVEPLVRSDRRLTVTGPPSQPVMEPRRRGFSKMAAA